MVRKIRCASTALAAILKRKFRLAIAHKSIFGSERNLTLAALDLSDGSILGEATTKARSTQAS
jgi:hypothetical protein